MRQFLKKWFHKTAPARRTAARRPSRVRPGLEALEDRTLMTITTTLIDVLPGVGASDPQRLTQVGNLVFFSARTPGTGRELFVTDGTVAGTRLVKDIAPGTASSNPEQLVNVNGTLFFTADVPGASISTRMGRELFKSAGTAAGTVLVKDIAVGSVGSRPLNLTPVGNTLFFTADPNTGIRRELFKSDGTAAGTGLVRDLFSGTATYNQLVNFNGTLFFSAGSGLFKSDGTAQGTVAVVPPALAQSPEELVVVNDTLYFRARRGGIGLELFKTDGTAAGTVLVKDIDPGLGNSVPFGFTNVNGTLFFTANDGVHGSELFKSDGTAAGTVLVEDLFPGSTQGIPNSSLPNFLTNVNGVLIFSATRAGTGRELFSSDGFEIELFDDIVPGAGSSTPERLVNVGGTLFYTATTPATGRELLGTDPDDGFPPDFANIRPGAGSSDPRDLLAVGNRLFFTADNGTNGRELFVATFNTPPMITDVALTSPVPAGQAATLTGRLVDPDDGDTLALRVEWGDGSAPEQITPNRDPFTLTHAYAAPGVYTVRLVWSDDAGNSNSRDLTVSVTTTPGAPPTVDDVVVNDGAAQRSMVQSLTVRFSGLVSLDEGALELLRADGSAVGLSVSTSTQDGKTVAVLTFQGDDVVAGSLADGSYRLVIRGDLVRGEDGQALDGDRDGEAGGDRLDAFFRLYGDSDGDGDVDKTDRQRFRRAFRSKEGGARYLAFFDYDGDGDIDRRDRRQFHRRFGTAVQS